MYSDWSSTGRGGEIQETEGREEKGENKNIKTTVGKNKSS